MNPELSNALDEYAVAIHIDDTTNSGSASFSGISVGTIRFNSGGAIFIQSLNWNKHTVHTKMREGIEYAIQLKEDARRLKEIIEG